MLIMETIAKIRQMYHKQGKSIRQIARQTQLNRRTVAKYINTTEPPQYHRKQQNYPALNEFINLLEQQLERDMIQLPKHRLSAQRHYEWLQANGYTGSYSSVSRFVAQFKKQHQPKDTTAFVPLSFPPADAYQFDWSTEMINLAGKKCKVQIAQFRLCHSRAFFLRAYFKQSSEMFLDAHNHAFEYFGGITDRGIYDNLKTAVTSVLSGKQREFNQQFLTMMNYFNIEPVACTPASGWEKGQVERQVSFQRQRMFIPIPKFETVDELNNLLLDFCKQMIRKLHHPQYKEQTVAEVFNAEQKHLISYHPFDHYRVVQAKVNSYCLVHFESCRYSVPCHLVRQAVSLHIRLDQISIVFNNEVVAEHKRIMEKDQTSYHPQHYLPLLKRKPGALRNGEPFLQWALPPIIKTLQRHLLKQPKGDRVMVEILTLIAEYGEEIGVTAAELALESGMPTAAAVQNIIHRLLEPAIPKLTGPEVSLQCPPQIDLERYNSILTHQAVTHTEGEQYATS